MRIGGRPGTEGSGKEGEQESGKEVGKRVPTSPPWQVWGWGLLSASRLRFWGKTASQANPPNQGQSAKSTLLQQRQTEQLPAFNFHLTSVSRRPRKSCLGGCGMEAICGRGCGRKAAGAPGKVVSLQRRQGTSLLGCELDEGRGRDPEGKHACKSQSAAEPAKSPTRRDGAWQADRSSTSKNFQRLTPGRDASPGHLQPRRWARAAAPGHGQKGSRGHQVGLHIPSTPTFTSPDTILERNAEGGEIKESERFTCLKGSLYLKAAKTVTSH